MLENTEQFGKVCVQNQGFEDKGGASGNIIH